MRKQRTTLLAGVAALALIAGTGIATAQQNTSQEHKGAMQPRASTPMKSNQGAGAVGQSTQTGKMGEAERTGGASGSTPGQKAQEGKMGQTEGTAQGETRKGKTAEQSAAERGGGANAKEPSPHAQQMDHANQTRDRFGEDKTKKGRMDEDRATQDERAGVGASTSEQRRQTGPNTAQSRDERLKGLQGNATGVVLNDEQRTRIRDTIINARGAPRVRQRRLRRSRRNGDSARSHPDHSGAGDVGADRAGVARLSLFYRPGRARHRQSAGHENCRRCSGVISSKTAKRSEGGIKPPSPTVQGFPSASNGAWAVDNRTRGSSSTMRMAGFFAIFPLAIRR